MQESIIRARLPAAGGRLIVVFRFAQRIIFEQDVLFLCRKSILSKADHCCTQPWIDLGLLDMARDVAAYNLPARVGQLFGVILY